MASEIRPSHQALGPRARSPDPLGLSIKARSLLLRNGCRNLRNALASSCRIRSRVTANSCPISLQRLFAAVGHAKPQLEDLLLSGGQGS